MERGYDGAAASTSAPATTSRIAELADTVMDVVGYDGRVVFDASKPDGTPRKLLDVGRLARLGWRARTSRAKASPAPMPFARSASRPNYPRQP